MINLNLRTLPQTENCFFCSRYLSDVAVDNYYLGKDSFVNPRRVKR